jgi:hypothetical protein
MARKNKRKRLPTVGRIVPIVAIRNRVYRELETAFPDVRPFTFFDVRFSEISIDRDFLTYRINEGMILSR